MSCMTPRASAAETAAGSKRLSWRMSAVTSNGSTLRVRAAGWIVSQYPSG